MPPRSNLPFHPATGLANSAGRQAAHNGLGDRQRTMVAADAIDMRIRVLEDFGPSRHRPIRHSDYITYRDTDTPQSITSHIATLWCGFPKTFSCWRVLSSLSPDFFFRFFGWRGGMADWRRAGFGGQEAAKLTL